MPPPPSSSSPPPPPPPPPPTPPTESDLEDRTAFANELANAAREAISPHWRRPIPIESKHEPDRPINESPVTIADRNAELAMRKLIEERHPDHGIYGEEYGSTRTDAEWVWVLDPIDGTKSFVTGKPLFGILVACLHRGVPVVGIIDQPVLNERWVGAKGKRTTFDGAPISTRPISETLSGAMLYASTPDMFRPGYESDRFDALRSKAKRAMYGADCYAYGLLAAGFGVDVVAEADLGLYDYCALVPVVEGAGGIMTDWDGEPLTLDNHERCKGRVVACSSRTLHEEAIGILRGNEKTPPRGRRSTTAAIVVAFAKSAAKIEVLAALAVGAAIGMAVSRPK